MLVISLHRNLHRNHRKLRPLTKKALKPLYRPQLPTPEQAQAPNPCTGFSHQLQTGLGHQILYSPQPPTSEQVSAANSRTGLNYQLIYMPQSPATKHTQPQTQNRLAGNNTWKSGSRLQSPWISSSTSAGQIVRGPQLFPEKGAPKNKEKSP